MSVKFSAHNSWAGNGCANFAGAWHFLVLSIGENLHAHKIPRFFGGGGGIWGFLGGGGANFSFQKLGNLPNLRKNVLGVKRPFSELSESSGAFSEQLSEFRDRFSEYEIPFSEGHLTT